MNPWLVLLGSVEMAFGVYVLCNLEKMLRWSQKYMEQNVGRVGKAFAEGARPRFMIYPGVGFIFVGVLVLLQGVDLL
ncbi:hypothetical protein [Agromyces humatus]|uniref:Uncharacterized protein n=1 Tax=Agromyces humatus TaxID=279573 RepID=A0ABN2KXV4_9MICO|nr:hypothetical protein [Agromyces humatus]